MTIILRQRIPYMYYQIRPFFISANLFLWFIIYVKSSMYIWLKNFPTKSMGGEVLRRDIKEKVRKIEQIMGKCGLFIF